MTDLGPGIPESLKHYRLVRRLGTGGMGAVFEAIDRRVDTRVAIKVLHAHLATDESFRERFEREAHVAALLRSPYTVHLLDYGYDQGHYFLVMEYIDGQSVAQLINAEGRLDPRRAVAIAADAARALEEANARGVVHRDIKPDNILLGADGSVKIADFGVSRREGGGGDLATSAGFIGTSAYAAPEQATENVDHRADIYALGGTLYCMLTGQPPFSGNAADLLRHHQESPLPMAPLAGLPDQLVNIVRRCMEKEREDRYDDASELVGALERAQRSLSAAGTRATDPVVAAPTLVDSSPSVLPGETQVSTPPGIARADDVTQVSPSAQPPASAAGPETVVSSMADIEAGSLRAGPGGADAKTPFARLPAGGGGGKKKLLAAIGGVAAVAVIGIAAALAFGGGGDGDSPAGGDETPSSRDQTRTVRTREAREETREARTAAANEESTPTARATSTATSPPATATTSIPDTPAVSTGRIVSGVWTYNFVTVSNTCGGDPELGETFENSFSMEDADGDGYVSDGEDVDIIDGQNGNYLGTFTFTYPSFTWDADLEEGDFVVLRNQYIGETSGSSLREDHYTVNGRPCVIAFAD